MDRETKAKFDEWVEACPVPIIARVIDDDVHLHHLAITAFVYESDTLVVTTVETLKNLFK